MPGMRVRRRNGRPRESGYMLLVLMLAVAVLTITMLGLAGNYRRSIVRDREVEMIHRGVQYERAVRLYYRKFGSYPPSIEALENTNNVRYLRKRYKDPMSPDGQWQVAHITDIKLTGIGGLTAVAGGATAPGSSTAPGSAGLVQTQLQTNAGNLSGVAAGSAAQSTDSGSTAPGTSSTGAQTSGTNPGNGPADANGPVGNGNGAGPVLGGGPMLGVLSKSKAEGIHLFNDKSHYNEWYFIYDPSQDKGQIPTGPYNPNLVFGSTASSMGTSGQSGAPTSSNPGMPGTTMPTTTIPTNNLAPTGASPPSWGVPTSTPTNP